ncbi:EthD domain-containing protein [Leptodontidium sp. 2 PMI_412]|nr:EthD domain-containing protein [Leptodontidium sp. 2 PMI_412]
MATPEIHRLYAMTIFGYKKTDMAEEDYHDYISNTHAGHLKALLAKNDIVSYTMQHNTSEVNVPMLEKIYAGRLPTGNISDCDAIIRIVFKDIQDYLRVREDPHFVSVVNPDHLNFADPRRTRFAVGWFEAHITAGKVVS